MSWADYHASQSLCLYKGQSLTSPVGKTSISLSLERFGAVGLLAGGSESLELLNSSIVNAGARTLSVELYGYVRCGGCPHQVLN